MPKKMIYLLVDVASAATTGDPFAGAAAAAGAVFVASEPSCGFLSCSPSMILTVLVAHPETNLQLTRAAIFTVHTFLLQRENLTFP